MRLQSNVVSRLLLAGLIATGTLARSQSTDESITRITPDKLTGTPANWKTAGNVRIGLESGVKSESGTTVLVGTPGQPITLLTGSKDIHLLMDVMLAPGTDASLNVSGATIRLADNWGSSAINDHTTGAVLTPRAELPSRSVGKAPGLWQRIDLSMEAGKSPAVLAQLKINGVLVQENLVLPSLPASAVGSVVLNVNAGTVAVRNVGYQLISERQVARLANLRYQFYEAKTETTEPAAIKNLKLFKEDTLNALTYEVSYGQPRWHAILYTGNLIVDKTGIYTLTMQHGGFGSLEVDQKPVLANSRMDLGELKSARINLTAGSHPFTLFFGRSWPRPGFGLFIAAPDTKPQALHTPTSLPEPDPVGAIDVAVQNEPVIIRSFIQLPDEARKRTHCLSVGTPSGLNYTVDLNQDALVQVWKGSFADATQMWYERGEPQLLEPLGAPVRTAPTPVVAQLANAQQAWPDSVSDADLRYGGYKLDKQGNPTMRYTYRGTAVTDALLPDADGKSLTRTVTVNGSSNDPLYCRLAAGKAIDDLGKGLYAIDDHSYYVRLDPKQKVSIRTVNGKQELVMPMKGNTTLNYALIW
ncbi:hypothetical protein [Spirosoma rhododendri]|uniref:PA14 domain-containing protein n=1 Tax=Spirosoma rhododendri TaxID=2728024 RepID=A0A7L5DJF2_9BACT|nr:hypothetical protein [Spirosoma rhododendri]QJD77243.1 hypothetical protein HH216_01510 [Spirosoma rhododendri]